MANINDFINERAEQAGISCKSYIVTVFGDVVSQHGGWIWLGSLIDSLQPLGFSERLIRTSVFRLVKDDWLLVNKLGRKSYYSFTGSANNHYTKAARRIYAGHMKHEDKGWLIIMPSFVCDEKMILLKRQLQWLGFSPLSSGAYAHPSIDSSSLEETITELELSDSVIIFSGQTFDCQSQSVLKRLVFEKWQVEELQERYQSLIDCYLTIWHALQGEHKISDQQSFLLRGLLIHEYRRILLRDHELPENLLPDNWAGFQAAKLVKQIYLHLARSSCRYIGSQLENMDGYLPPAIENFKLRFK
ncbi:PaaX family transcriptional regulator [Aliikangiella sp. IMCC44359]|uniref:PaaX family transcriptional regulator n=1 Tax=Aliikangiella sp. IMCC44359 TaxID=3459125 RepID=UPI00403AFB34